MRPTRLVPLAAVLALLLAPAPARAEDRYVGTITSTSPTAANNATTGVPFTLAPLAYVTVQCDAAAYVHSYPSSASAVATTTGVKLAADQLYVLRLGGPYLSVMASTGTASCRVFVNVDGRVR